MASTRTSPEGERELIPLFDLRLTEADLAAVEEVLRSGWLTLGPRTIAFEEAFAAHLGAKFAVAVSSCTAALHLAYLAAGVGPGDEVIVPAFTFAATGAAALYCGATPVFADILGPHDLSIDPEDVAAKITERTKAVTVVHFAGYPGPVKQLRELCDARGIALVEDVAHAPSADVDGRKLGTWGVAGCFSFFSNKVLSAGEGGLLATDDETVATLARRRRSHGMTSGTWDRHTKRAGQYDVRELGMNYRIDEVRSALLHSRLAGLEDDIAQRRRLTRRYHEELAKIDGIVVPYAGTDLERSSCYVLPILLEDPAKQGPLRIALREDHGVQTSLFYPGTHEFTAYRERFPGVSLPRTERASRTEVTLPLYPHMTDAEQDRVLTALAQELGAR